METNVYQQIIKYIQESKLRDAFNLINETVDQHPHENRAAAAFTNCAAKYSDNRVVVT